jgi:anti-anti-sigma factor
MTLGGLEYRVFDAFAIARLRDRWPDHAAVQKIRKELRHLLADDSIRNVVLDFEEVEYFDANVLALLVTTSRELARRGGRLVLCSLPRVMRGHSSIMVFGQRLMTIVEGQDDAIRLLCTHDDDGD